MQVQPVLLGKCRRLRSMLEASTDAVDGGRRVRDCVDAAAFSRAADDVYSAASMATQRIIQRVVMGAQSGPTWACELGCEMGA